MQCFRAPPSPNLDSFAIAYCTAHYEFSLGFAAKLPELSCTPLPDCARALGLATYARITSSDKLLVQAQQHYQSALQKTNAALASPLLACTDQTLIAVMVLSNLETILARGEDGDLFCAWSAHAIGSASLLQIRGKAQLATSAGRLLFAQASANVVFNCVRTGARIPAPIRILIYSAAPEAYDDGYDTTSWLVLRARLGLADLYSDFARHSIRDLDAVAVEILRLDSDLRDRLELERNPTPAQRSRRYQTCQAMTTIPLSEVMLEFMASQCCLSMLVIRMVLHLLLLAVLRRFGGGLTSDPEALVQGRHEQMLESSRALEQMQDQVLVLVQEHIELVKAENRLSLDEHRPAPFRLVSSQAGVSNVACMWAEQILIAALNPSVSLHLERVQDPRFRLSRGYSVIWPLTLVGQLADPDSERRTMTCRLLRAAGQSLDIGQAFLLADVLERDIPEPRFTNAA